MKKNNYAKFYRVFKHDTAVTEVSSNNFITSLKPPKVIAVQGTSPVMAYSLPVGDAMFYGYLTKAEAMEKAKHGALLYIDLLIGRGESGIGTLKQYRMDHYEDLNVNLLEANIRKSENTLNN
jgi:hypothetical protein